jgi:hypothetical protein
VQRLDVGELGQFVVLAPGEESADRMEVSRPRVLVADRGGEELHEATRGLFPASATIAGTTMLVDTVATVRPGSVTVSWRVGFG